MRIIYKTGFSSLESIQQLAEKLKIKLGFIKNIDVLKKPITINEFTIPNRIAIHPMEGADATKEGAPTNYTKERYINYANGCAGLIWFEACSIDFPKAKTHNAMLLISKKNLPALRELVDDVKEESERSLDEVSLDGRALLVLQLSHAGRFRVEKSDRSPILAYRHQEMDHHVGVTEEFGRLITDDELDELQVSFVEAAKLAFNAGFDAVDIKACHSYLLNNLLSAYTRDGKYGGNSYKNRSRFLLETIEKIKKETGGIVTSRLSGYDGIPSPYGFGTSETLEKGSGLPFFVPTEPIRILKDMKSMGVDLVNISIGNPYYSQFLTRPFEVKMPGQKVPPEHPLVSVSRHFEIVEKLKEAVPDMVFIGSGYSWLRHLGIYASAYNIEKSRTDIAGWGRLAFSHPGFPRETFMTRSISGSKACITCSGCSRLLRAELRTGCVIQNPETFRESMQKIKEMGI